MNIFESTYAQRRVDEISFLHYTNFETINTLALHTVVILVCVDNRLVVLHTVHKHNNEKYNLHRIKQSTKLQQLSL